VRCEHGTIFENATLSAGRLVISASYLFFLLLFAARSSCDSVSKAFLSLITYFSLSCATVDLVVPPNLNSPLLISHCRA
jgi:hypothetical protein